MKSEKSSYKVLKEVFRRVLGSRVHHKAAKELAWDALEFILLYTASSRLYYPVRLH